MPRPRSFKFAQATRPDMNMQTLSPGPSACEWGAWRLHGTVLSIDNVAVTVTLNTCVPLLFIIFFIFFDEIQTGRQNPQTSSKASSSMDRIFQRRLRWDSTWIPGNHSSYPQQMPCTIPRSVAVLPAPLPRGMSRRCCGKTKCEIAPLHTITTSSTLCTRSTAPLACLHSRRERRVLREWIKWRCS